MVDRVNRRHISINATLSCSAVDAAAAVGHRGGRDRAIASGPRSPRDSRHDGEGRAWRARRSQPLSRRDPDGAAVGTCGNFANVGMPGRALQRPPERGEDRPGNYSVRLCRSTIILMFCLQVRPAGYAAITALLRKSGAMLVAALDRNDVCGRGRG